VGGAVGAFVGILKARFNIHEVVSTIMLNYIFQFIVGFFIKNYYVDPISRQSRAVAESARLTLMNVPVGEVTTRLPLCFLLAVGVAALLYFLLKKTSLGFEIRAVGANKKAAQYAGIRSNRVIVMAMALSGCCAGLAGVTYYLGYFDTIEPGALTSVGFDSIAVALLANSSPVACVLSSLLITTMTYGSTYMSSIAGVSAYIASLMVGIVLLFCACGAYLKYRINKSGLARADEAGDEKSPPGSDDVEKDGASGSATEGKSAHGVAKGRGAP
jgi:simple sugar transport system permease protein